jgi:hypothetical protein
VSNKVCEHCNSLPKGTRHYIRLLYVEANPASEDIFRKIGDLSRAETVAFGYPRVR